MSATKKTQLLENEEPEPVANTVNITININVYDGGTAVVNNEPKENPPKPPGSGG